jgi:integrase
MPRSTNRLTAVSIRNASKRGLHADGNGLYLQIAKGGAKSWIFSYVRNGERRNLGLGGVAAVTLAKAREKAAAMRALLADGRDPLSELRAERQAAAGVKTFRQCAEEYIRAHEPGWRNPKHRQQWTNTLQTYAYPVIGDLPVNQVDDGHVLKILKPIWLTKTETAKRLQGRLENILDYAKATKERAGENPARWRAHLDQMLVRPSKVQRVRHHPALPYAELPAFWAELRQEEGIGAQALQFTILTACRTGEVIMARLSEIDGEVWIIPGERTKSGREHRVPLVPAARAVLAGIKPVDAQPGDWIFPGDKPGRPLSDAAMSALLERMERTDITVHGFRSTFRDWVEEETNFPTRLAEAALAHKLKDETEGAYQRGDLLRKRRRLMEAWARYATQPAKKAGEVVAIRRL